MNLNEELARRLDVMRAAQLAGGDCDWARCRSLVAEALKILDDAGCGATWAALRLAEALDQLDRARETAAGDTPA